MRTVLNVRYTFEWLDHREPRLCYFLNRAVSWRPVLLVFSWVSRLGDGVIWYCLMLAILLCGGDKGVITFVHMATGGILGLLIYKWLKGRTIRPRPCARTDITDELRVPVLPLDEYSFPSGHALHAFSFSIIAVSHFPQLLWLLAPFTLLVALSRVVLGLHYPSDVIIGAVLGILVATGVLSLSSVFF